MARNPKAKKKNKVDVQKEKDERVLQFEDAEELPDCDMEAANEECDSVEEAPEAEVEVPVEIDPAKELEESKDKYLRLLAEYDNYRKRTKREKEDFCKYASADLIEKLIPVLDTFQRGVAANEQADDIESVKEGMSRVYKMFWEVLEKEGLLRLEQVEIPFDVNLHMAVFQEEHEEFEENTVLEVFETGYQLKDKVLRPAKVKVSK